MTPTFHGNYFYQGMCPLPDHEKYKMENKLVDSGLFLENAEHGVVFLVSEKEQVMCYIIPGEFYF